MATLTASLAASTRYPKRVHVGSNQVTVNYVFDATATDGDSVLMMKVPNGAVIHDMVLSYGSNLDAGGNGVSITVGDQNNAARFISSSTTSGAARIARIDTADGVGYKYDFSDDVSERDRNDKLVLDISGSISTSVTVTLSVLYSVDT